MVQEHHVVQERNLLAQVAEASSNADRAEEQAKLEEASLLQWKTWLDERVAEDARRRELMEEFEHQERVKEMTFARDNGCPPGQVMVLPKFNFAGRYYTEGQLLVVSTAV